MLTIGQRGSAGHEKASPPPKWPILESWSETKKKYPRTPSGDSTVGANEDRRSTSTNVEVQRNATLENFHFCFLGIILKYEFSVKFSRRKNKFNRKKTRRQGIRDPIPIPIPSYSLTSCFSDYVCFLFQLFEANF